MSTVSPETVSRGVRRRTSGRMTHGKLARSMTLAMLCGFTAPAKERDIPQAPE